MKPGCLILALLVALFIYMVADVIQTNAAVQLGNDFHAWRAAKLKGGE